MKRQIIFPTLRDGFTFHIDVYDDGADLVVTDEVSLCFFGVPLTKDPDYIQWLQVNQSLVPALYDAGLWYKKDKQIGDDNLNSPYLSNLNIAIEMGIACLLNLN